MKSNPADVARRDRIVALVESLLAMNRTLARSVSPAERGRLEAACAEADAEIDRIVYALYGLTDEEIAIVEGTGLAGSSPTQRVDRPPRHPTLSRGLSCRYSELYVQRR
jgi:hypothetical protein